METLIEVRVGLQVPCRTGLVQVYFADLRTSPELTCRKCSLVCRAIIGN